MLVLCSFSENCLPSSRQEMQKCKCCVWTKTLEFDKQWFEERISKCLCCRAKDISWISVCGIKGKLYWCKEELCVCKEEEEKLSECLKKSPCTDRGSKGRLGHVTERKIALE